jgi:hypothetical protein
MYSPRPFRLTVFPGFRVDREIPYQDLLKTLPSTRASRLPRRPVLLGQLLHATIYSFEDNELEVQQDAWQLVELDFVQGRI